MNLGAVTGESNPDAKRIKRFCEHEHRAEQPPWLPQLMHSGHSFEALLQSVRRWVECHPDLGAVA